MTRPSVALAIGIAAAAGFYFARLLQANDDLRGAKARLAGAIKVAWGARRVMVYAGGIGFAMIWVWLHTHGHGH